MKTTAKSWDRLREVGLNPALGLALLVFAGLLTEVDHLPDPALFPEQVVEIEGTIAEPPQQGSDSLYFELTGVILGRNPGVSLQGRIGVTVRLSEGETHALPGWGERIRFSSQLRERSHYLAPGVADARIRALRQGVVRVASLKSVRQILPVRAPAGWKSVLGSIRNQFLERCEEHLSAPVLALVEASFLGNRRALGADLMRDLQTTQLVHLFSISGFHVTILLAALRWLFSPLGGAGSLLASAVMWVYVLMIGGPMTAVRAALAATIALLAWQIGVRGRFFNTLGLVALVLMIAWPPASRTAGFQFSFLALAAIGAYLGCTRPWLAAVCRGARSVFADEVLPGRAREAVRSRRVRFACEQWLEFGRGTMLVPIWRGAIRILRFPLHWICLTSLIQVMTLPLSLHYSNRLAWGQLPANLVLGPLFSVMLLVILLSFSTFWTPLAPFVLGVLEGVGRLWLELLEAMSGLSPETWLPHPSAGLVLFCTVLAGLLMWLSRHSLPPAALVTGGLVAWLMAIPGARPSGRLEVTFLDVGQGDSIHLRYPDGSSGLVDTGGLVFSEDPDYLARAVVARYLWQEGVERLRYMLLSHDHLDHVQGLGFLLRAFPVESLWIGPDHPIGRLAEPVAVRRLARGDEFQVAGVSHRILHPSIGGPDGVRSENQQSVVVELEYGGTRILFPGDVGEREERQFQADARTITVLKVPHHGSSGSNSLSFLRAFSPLFSVVSAGRNNPFGHPSREALSRFRELGIPLYGTADRGSIRFETDGSNWIASHFQGGKWELLEEGVATIFESLRDWRLR